MQCLSLWIQLNSETSISQDLKLEKDVQHQTQRIVSLEQQLQVQLELYVWYTQVIPPTCKSLNLNLTRSGHWEVLDMTAKKIGHPTHSPSCETFKIRATCPKWWCRRIPLRNNGAQLKVQWSPRVVRMSSVNLLVMVSGSNRFLSNTSASLSVFRGFELFKRLWTELDNDVDIADVFWRPFLLSEFTWDLF